MIPKIIHYCWFGRGNKPELVKKCIASWKKHCPDYQIIEWNEDNVDISSCPAFVQQAMAKKIYCFVSDYVRYQVVYTYGGIYLDTDVEALQSFDSFLDNTAFFGFCKQIVVASGIGFGAEKGLGFLRELMDIYEHAVLFRNGSINYGTNTSKEKTVFVRHGLISNGETQMLDNGVRIYAEEYFSPYDYRTKKMAKTERTVSIHWWSTSMRKSVRKSIRKKKVLRRIGRVVALPLKILKMIVGEEKYKRIREKIYSYVL